jgi:hypothetical protein
VLMLMLLNMLLNSLLMFMFIMSAGMLSTCLLVLFSVRVVKIIISVCYKGMQGRNEHY